MQRKLFKPLLLFCMLTVFLFTTLDIASAQQENHTDINNSTTPQGIDEDLFIKGQQAITSYLASNQQFTTNGDILVEGSREYEGFLFDVLNDHHPILTASSNQNEVVYYAVTFLGLVSDHTTPDAIINPTWQVNLPLITRDNTPNPNNGATSVEEPVALSTITYNRTNAVNYANTWVTSGGRRRNSQYPDFSSDCTNFTSQVALAGGIRMVGDGSCRDENNPREWYVKRLSSNCGWPGQSLRNWAWSRSWSVVADFRVYMRDQRVARVVEAYGANNEAVSLLISRARPGDFIQYDVRECSFFGCSWRPTHGVVVVQAITNQGYHKNDVFVNDHSGSANNTDTVRGSLRAKLNQWIRDNNTNNRRMVWIQMP
ncbi:MAG: amidase domain-containing protein [Oscillochloridaceae bacterium umkhey_bin13]